ncbi:MAG: Gfo/Idh/MocA family oxidoreductase [Acidobacteriota bacterium]|nr:Gfo/Idh/MocA family oxidoreductase [Acidobacteriota bacterium]
MSEARIRVAVIGAGEHGSRHARHYASIPGAELAGVYDIRAGRGQALAAELGVKAFNSLDEVWKVAEAASLVIPTTDHAAVAREALVNGVDLLVEKPISRTVAEAEELIRVASERNRILQVGHVERFNPGVVAAKAITHGPLFFEVHRLGVFSARSLDVDVVYDLMIHDLDLVLWLVGSQVREVRAVGLPVLSDKVDIANARVEFENGAVANLTASRVSTEKVRKFRYFQPSEYISIDFTRQDALVVTVDRGGAEAQIGFRKIETPKGEPLRSEIEAFLHSVRTRTPPLAGGEAGRLALELAGQVMSCIQEHAGKINLRLTQPAGQSGES